MSTKGSFISIANIRMDTRANLAVGGENWPLGGAVIKGRRREKQRKSEPKSQAKLVNLTFLHPALAGKVQINGIAKKNSMKILLT